LVYQAVLAVEAPCLQTHHKQALEVLVIPRMFPHLKVITADLVLLAPLFTEVEVEVLVPLVVRRTEAVETEQRQRFLVLL
jgi:nicotinamide mononucleotide adenylyltransferase